MDTEKTAPLEQGADTCASGIVSTPESHIFVLDAMLGALLEYGELILPPAEVVDLTALYADALKNAIRCIRLVIALEELMNENRSGGDHNE